MIGKFAEKISSALPKLSNLQKLALNFAKSAALTSIAVTSLLIGARQVGILEPLELGAFDQMVRWRSDEGPDPRLLIVRITEGDIQKLKEWPISDHKVAQILENLERLKPRVIGLDLLRDVPLGKGRTELIKLLNNSKDIISVCLLSDGTIEQPGSPPAAGLTKEQVGFADLVVDSGGVLRRTAFFIQPLEPPGVEKHLCNDSSVPFLTSFGFQIAHLYLKKQGIESGQSPEGNLMLGSTMFTALKKNSGGYKDINVGGYQLLINYRSPRNVAQYVNFIDVLENKIDPKLVKDRIVLIGYATDTVKDAFYTPYSGGNQKDQSMPGIVVHGQIISQIISAVLDKRPLFWFWSESTEILWIWGWSILGATLAWKIQQPLRFGLAGGGILAVSLGLSFGIFMLGGWVPVVTPAIALIASAGSVVLADRFNKGGYGKVITDKVKQVFKIEIDQSKKEQEVAEIIDSEFFKELQQKKTELKGRKRESSPEESPQLPESETESQTTESQTEDYFAQLGQKAKQQKAQGTQKNEEIATSDAIASPSTNHSDPAAETSGEEGFSDLIAKAKQMKKSRSSGKNEDLPPEN
jgi:adenylate cyclase